MSRLLVPLRRGEWYGGFLSTFFASYPRRSFFLAPGKGRGSSAEFSDWTYLLQPQCNSIGALEQHFPIKPG